MGKEINIVHELHPESYKLIQDDEGSITTTIVDEELDSYECEFGNDNCIKINTEGYKHITLSVEDLYRLIDLIEESTEMYEEQED